MNLRQIEVFRTVMIAGTITDAAGMLGVTQPVVSKIILHLEEQLSVPLFERSRGRLIPTPEARLLFSEIELVWKGVERIQAISRGLGGSFEAPLRLVVSPSLGTEVVPRAVAQLCKTYPQLQIVADIVPDIPLVDILLSNQADVGVTLLPVEHPMCDSTPLATGRMVCVLPKGHKLAGRKAIALEDIMAFPLVSFSKESPDGRLLDIAFRSSGHERRPTVVVRSGQAACWFVRRGCGIAIVDEFTVAAEAFAGIAVCSLKDQISFQVSLVCNRFQPKSSIARKFEVVLREQLEELREKL